jgi:hypothetical protein
VLHVLGGRCRLLLLLSKEHATPDSACPSWLRLLLLAQLSCAVADWLAAGCCKVARR